MGTVSTKSTGGFYHPDVSPCISDGDFATGDASEDMYDPSPILDDENDSGGGVVVVTVAFRVGPFGFLSLGSDAVPGNMVKFSWTTIGPTF